MQIRTSNFGCLEQIVIVSSVPLQSGTKSRHLGVDPLDAVVVDDLSWVFSISRVTAPSAWELPRISTVTPVIATLLHFSFATSRHHRSALLRSFAPKAFGKKRTARPGVEASP